MMNKLYSNRQIILSAAFVTLIIGGWFYPPLGYFMVFCMFAAMALGVIKGRKWCDWYCPRGSFYDSFLKRFSRNLSVPTLFRHPLFRAGWLALLMYMVKATPQKNKNVYSSFRDLIKGDAPQIVHMLI